MIISASRRTDIPCFYSKWMRNRLEAGLVRVRNPFNAASVREVPLRPEDVDCVVFWTKDPKNLLDSGLTEYMDSRGYMYYFQFTLTPYSRDIERGLRPKRDIEATFAALSGAIGRERVRWRYDPIILNDSLAADFHIREFERMCGALSPHTEGVTISFVDGYTNVKSPLIGEISEEEALSLATSLAAIARCHGLEITACCEPFDLTPAGVDSAACVDGQLVARLTGNPMKFRRDRNQRPGCGCAESADIGVYNTCLNDCAYCYATRSAASAEKNARGHDPSGEFLI